MLNVGSTMLPRKVKDLMSLITAIDKVFRVLKKILK